MAVGAFHGGPLRVGWAPWVLGGIAAALAVGYLITTSGRRRPPTTDATASAYGSQPAPLNLYGPTIPLQTGGTGLTAPSGVSPYPSGITPTGASNASAQQLAQFQQMVNFTQ